MQPSHRCATNVVSYLGGTQHSPGGRWTTSHVICHSSIVIYCLSLVICSASVVCPLFWGGIAESLRCLLLILITFRTQLCAVCLQRGRQGAPIFQQEIIWSARSSKKHNTRFLPQGNISPGTKLEEGKGNAASGDVSSLLRAMMMWSHRAQTSYSQPRPLISCSSFSHNRGQQCDGHVQKEGPPRH